MKFAKLSMIAALGLAAGVALADSDRRMSVASMEDRVPHIKLVECPAIIAAQNASCYIVKLDGTLHVAAFSNDGERRLVELRSAGGGEMLSLLDVH